MMPNRNSTFAEATLNSQEEVKRKEDADRLRPYWRFVLPLCFFLVLMVIFPLRIGLPELTNDVIFYGMISTVFVALAIWISQRFGRRGYRLIAVILLCIVLSGWQVFDLLVLRTEGVAAYGWGAGQGQYFGMSQPFTDYDGVAWYGLRFPNKEIVCNSLYEQYWGTPLIAITVRIDRDATWFACGG